MLPIVRRNKAKNDTTAAYAAQTDPLAAARLQVLGSC